jgi:hypothetical protein
VLGCATAEAHRERDSKGLGSTVSTLLSEADAGDFTRSGSALRRSYSSSDMKFHACATPEEDGTIIGKQCPSAIVVFGPYVTVPADADIRLRFDITSPMAVKLTSDVLSNSARQFHGALEEQDLAANQKRTISYRIHVFDSVNTLETRVGVRTDVPLDFTITDLRLTIQ